MKATYSKRRYLSITTLLDFARCPRRYYYRKSGLTLPDADRKALVYGTAMHKAVPIAFTNPSLALTTFESLWDPSLDDEKRSLARATQQLTHFHNTHKDGKSLYTLINPPNSDIPTGLDVSPFEVPVVVDLGLEVPIVARIDGLARHRDSGELWGWEFKTSSRLNTSIFTSLELHPQILAYTLMLRALTGESVRGMIVEVMLIDPRKCDNLCHPLYVNDAMLEGAKRWIVHYGSMLLELERRDSGEGEAFIQNYAGCSAYSHFYIPTYPCEYAQLCQTTNWRDMESMYEVVPERDFFGEEVER